MIKPFPYGVAAAATVLILTILVGIVLSLTVQASHILEWGQASLPPAADTPGATPTPAPTPTKTPAATPTPTATPGRQPSRLALYILKAGQGEISQNPQPGLSDNKYPSGTMVNLMATPAYGWEFDSWSGDANIASTSIVIVMDADKRVTANFKARFALLTNQAEDTRSRIDSMVKKELDLAQQTKSLEEEKQRLQKENQGLYPTTNSSAGKNLWNWRQDGILFIIIVLLLFALGGLASSLLFINLIWRGKIRRGRG